MENAQLLQTVRRLASGEIIGIKIGNDWCYEANDVDTFIANCKAVVIAEIKTRQAS